MSESSRMGSVFVRREGGGVGESELQDGLCVCEEGGGSSRSTLSVRMARVLSSPLADLSLAERESLSA